MPSGRVLLTPDLPEAMFLQVHSVHLASDSLVPLCCLGSLLRALEGVGKSEFGCELVALACKCLVLVLPRVFGLCVHGLTDLAVPNVRSPDHFRNPGFMSLAVRPASLCRWIPPERQDKCTNSLITSKRRDRGSAPFPGMCSTKQVLKSDYLNVLLWKLDYLAIRGVDVDAFQKYTVTCHWQ